MLVRIFAECECAHKAVIKTEKEYDDDEKATQQQSFLRCLCIEFSDGSRFVCRCFRAY